MTITKSHIQLTALLFLFAFSKVAFSTQLAANEIKTDVTISDSDIKMAVNTATDYDHQRVNDDQPLQNMEQRYRQIQQEQLDAYKRFLENRKRQSSAYRPEDIQTRRDEYVKQMEQRRALIKNMMNERRKAVQERREKMLLKMHQTSITFAITEKA